ncbi:MAG: WD40 repeat domain-containing protein [Leptolyngbyaceae cyanobacterium bins.59]|nr:WD40 repeat domain-containing protein [Leptolyngbyaceae cyanobacterium bins.59]
MNSKPEQPRRYDAVLGGTQPGAIGGLVLGGLEGVRQRLTLPDEDQRVQALQDALKYGRSGLSLVIKGLQDESLLVQKTAFVLLRHRKDAEIRKALQGFNFYRFFGCLRTLKGGQQTAISPDGETIALLNKSIKVYDHPSGELLYSMPHHPGGWELFILSNEAQFFIRSTAGDQHRLEVWQQAELLHTLYGHGAAIRSLALSGDQRTLASGGDDGTIKLWSVRSGKTLWTIDKSLAQGTHTGPVLGLAFSPDHKTLVSHGADGKVKLWDLESRDRPRLLQVRGLRFLTISTEGLLAGVDWEGKVRLWHLASGTFLQLLDRRFYDCYLAFSPSGRTLAIASSLSIYLYDLRTGKPSCTLLGHERAIDGLRFNSTGEWLVSSSQDKKIKIWGVP